MKLRDRYLADIRQHDGSYLWLALVRHEYTLKGLEDLEIPKDVVKAFRKLRQSDGNDNVEVNE